VPGSAAEEAARAHPIVYDEATGQKFQAGGGNYMLLIVGAFSRDM
jgi:hypothetical protein